MDEKEIIRVALSKEHIGYTLAKDIYRVDDILILNEGTELSETKIERLLRLEINYVYVYKDKENLNDKIVKC
ncbi:MAG: hypothetical protein K0R54_206 [Clostridiaceae bacterium]|jgi:hypothetical protein|nr:hypothetical protein [Clostridiaceae bacterium]